MDRVETPTMRGAGLPALPIRMGRMDARWARGELERFGPRISLTGAAPLRREQIPPRPYMGMVAEGASEGVRTFQRLSLLRAMPGERVGEMLANRSVLGLEYPGEVVPPETLARYCTGLGCCAVDECGSAVAAARDL